MTEEQIRAGVVLAASRGVLSAFASEESLGEAANGYHLAPRTPEGDAFETAFEWAREIKASGELSLGLPRVLVTIREAEASARSKAFEEAEAICNEGLNLEGPPPVIRAAIVVTGKMLARKIRARAEEAPHG